MAGDILADRTDIYRFVAKIFAWTSTLEWAPHATRLIYASSAHT